MGSKEDFRRSENCLHDTIMLATWHYRFVQAHGRHAPRGDRQTLTWPGGFISRSKCPSLVGNVDSRVHLHLGGQGVCGQSQHLPLSFAMKSKTGLGVREPDRRGRLEAQPKVSASVSPSQGGQLEGAAGRAAGVGWGEHASKLPDSSGSESRWQVVGRGCPRCQGALGTPGQSGIKAFSRENPGARERAGRRVVTALITGVCVVTRVGRSSSYLLQRPVYQP